MFNSQVLILVLLFVGACAWNKDRNQNPTLTQTSFDFEKEELDKLGDKFEISKPTIPEVKPILTTQTEIKKNDSSSPQLITAPSKKSKIENDSTEKAPKEESIIDLFFGNNLSYPKDYPQEFIEYDKRYVEVWKQFEPIYIPNEEIQMDIKYLGVTAGRVTIQTLPEVKIGNKTTYHFYANMISAPFYKYIYSLDDSVETFLSKKNFTPLKYILVQRESGQAVDDLQLFDHEELKTYFWYKRIKNKKESKDKKIEYVPRYFQDSLSALFFVRGLPMKIGNKYEFPVVTRTKVWIIKVEVMAKEDLKIEGKTYNTYRLRAETHFPGVLEKRGDIVFWYSADASRKILKFLAKVKIGHLEGVYVEPLP